MAVRKNVPGLSTANGRVAWAIELKLGLTFAAVAQADQWRHRAHYVSVATPPMRVDEARVLAEEVLRARGIGWLMVSPHHPYVQEAVKAERFNVSAHRLLGTLKEEMKTYAPAGNPGARRFTAFKGTIEAVKALVQKQPGITLKEIVSQLGTGHYDNPANARRGVARAVDAGWIPGVEGRREHGLLRLYPRAAI